MDHGTRLNSTLNGKRCNDKCPWLYVQNTILRYLSSKAVARPIGAGSVGLPIKLWEGNGTLFEIFSKLIPYIDVQLYLERYPLQNKTEPKFFVRS